MPVGPPGSQARFDVLNMRRKFNDQVDAYNILCGSSKAAPFDDKLQLGPKGPTIPGRRLVEDFYTR
jgi:hypothetical protein